jgi:hypothetical protein
MISYQIYNCEECPLFSKQISKVKDIGADFEIERCACSADGMLSFEKVVGTAIMVHPNCPLKYNTIVVNLGDGVVNI